LGFEHPAQQIVFQDYVDAVGDAERRLKRVEGQILALLSDWSLSPIVDALQAMRGIAVINAVVLVAEVGDFSRFANPRQLMAYFDLVPSERAVVEPGHGAPTHVHAVEKVLTVLAGEAEIWVKDERAVLTRQQSVVISANNEQGFKNVGSGRLHVHAILASPAFVATYGGCGEGISRWVSQKTP
jgi:hypothetical protein